MRSITKNKVKKVWLGIFLLMIFLLLWVNQSVRTTQMAYQIQEIENEIKKEENKRIELEIQRDQYLSLDFVESVAKKKLGLIVPKEENIVVMALPDTRP